MIVRWEQTSGQMAPWAEGEWVHHSDYAALEACLESLLRARPSGLECKAFDHAPKDRHEGLDCPCKKRWDEAVEAAGAILKA